MLTLSDLEAKLHIPSNALTLNNIDSQLQVQTISIGWLTQCDSLIATDDMLIQGAAQMYEIDSATALCC